MPAVFHKVGFTGTQQGMTPQQAEAVNALLTQYTPKEAHHGDCIGADTQFHELAVAHGIRTIIHPPDNDYKRAYNTADETRPPQPFLTRNHNIVDEVDLLIGTPNTTHEVLRSGTWATLRYARKTGTRLALVTPDGTVHKHGPPLT